ncbi:MAG: DUF1343 domain-containing protein [Bacteroidota bacterium]|nr:DUF1343 domain-containing protein [Bacteroidota bacterium]
MPALEKNDNDFLLGNEVLLSKSSYLIKDKRIGLITNTSGVLSNGALFLDSLNKNFNVIKIFTPEHGLRGDDKNENYTDELTGISIVSLYGSKKKPDPYDLENVDAFIYDIQDVGARFYTFINTMFYCMEAAVENKKEMIICDRPLIPDANYVDGFIVEESVKSFVGLLNVPVAYGMTCGELAGYINAEYFNDKCNLSVVKMENYTRETDYESLELRWAKPSPSIYFPSSAVCYLGTCLFEGTNFAEGRGTARPFEYIGASYCDGKKLADELNSFNFKGVTFENITFTPQTITSTSNPPKYIGEVCEGVFINVSDKKTFEPVKAAIAVLVSLKKLFPEFQINGNNFLDKLAGTPELREMLNTGSSYDEIINLYSTRLNEFKINREKYLLYN